MQASRAEPKNEHPYDHLQFFTIQSSLSEGLAGNQIYHENDERRRQQPTENIAVSRHMLSAMIAFLALSFLTMVATLILTIRMMPTGASETKGRAEEIQQLIELSHEIIASKANETGRERRVFDKDCSQDGWVYYGNFGYLIINIRTMKWSDARRTCQMLGGDLAIIKSAAENNFIFSLLKKQKTVTDLGVWLGFVRKADNKFYWIDDTPLENGYTAWDSCQPDHVIEKCGNMFGSPNIGVGGKWNDATCYIDPANHWKFAPVILCKKKQTV